MKTSLGTGFKYNEGGDWEQALGEFEQVLSIDPTSLDAGRNEMHLVLLLKTLANIFKICSIVNLLDERYFRIFYY